MESKSERQKPYDMWNLKYGMDDPIYTTEIDHRHGKQIYGCQGERGKEWDVQEVWSWWMQTVRFVMERQWGPTVQYREQCVIGSPCCTTEIAETL